VRKTNPVRNGRVGVYYYIEKSAQKRKNNAKTKIIAIFSQKIWIVTKK